MDENKKTDVLIAALEERYSSIHKIRDRVQSTGVWALGLLLGASGWLIQSEVYLTSTQKSLGILGVLAAFVALRFFYLEDLQKGFKAQQQTAAKLEKALGFFTPGFFDGSDKTLYPESWEHSGTDKGSGKFFDTTYMLLYIGFVFLILVIFLNGICVHAHHHEFYQMWMR